MFARFRYNNLLFLSLIIIIRLDWLSASRLGQWDVCVCSLFPYVSYTGSQLVDLDSEEDSYSLLPLAFSVVLILTVCLDVIVSNVHFTNIVVHNI